MVTSITVIVIAAVLMFLGMNHFKRGVSGSLGAKKDTLVARIAELDQELNQLASAADLYAAKAQLEAIAKMQEEVKVELEKSKALLKETEGKLEAAQKGVEAKELQHQAVKSAKANEEQQLAEVAARYEMFSQQAIDLEKQVAASLKELDQMMNEVKATAVQKEIMQGLSQALLSSGSRLRELIGEYNSVNERVEMTKQQIMDLEDEYTKLVEQQLGA